MASRYGFRFLIGLLVLGLLTACGSAEVTETGPAIDAPGDVPPPVPPPTEALAMLRANPWQWTGYDNGSGLREVESPTSYRAAFNNDATLAIAADCNSAAGSYQVNEIRGNALTIEIGPVTAAACPEGSRSDEFISLLAAAVGLHFDEGNLLIEVAQEAGLGTMVFAPAEASAP